MITNSMTPTAASAACATPPGSHHCGPAVLGVDCERGTAGGAMRGGQSEGHVQPAGFLLQSPVGFQNTVLE